MRLSLRWLNDFVDVSEFLRDPQALAKHLTNAGLEVESIEDQGKQFSNVVVGAILEKGQHPNADRLTLCQVTTGDGVVHQIVCGAKNHKQGDRVVVALPGAVLPGDFAIKRSKIRDVESGGMLCSEKELGLKGESDGILILPADAPIGMGFAEYRKLDDVVFELKVTPNRADCLSHYGLALEVGCLLGREIRKPKTAVKASATKGDIAVEIKAKDLGPRYAGRMVRGVKVGPSPDWLKVRLETVGMKSINCVVDVTNYVMMEMGQPLHAFDVRELKGHGIVVDRARAGEPFTTLDGTELKLDGTELTIRDRERPVALAGVIGGKNSGVQDDTNDVFIESAYFTPGAVRRTMRKFGLDTDSGYRFARGVNPDTTVDVLERAVSLMIEVAGGEAAADTVDVYPEPVPKPEITVSLATVEARLGYKIDAATFEMWMKRLGGELKTISPEQYRFLSPGHRTDLHVEMDLVEEFARLNGYDKLPESLPGGSFQPASDDPGTRAERRVRRVLQGLGCLQALNYAFIGDRYQGEFLGDAEKLRACGLHVDDADVKVVNPLNEEINVMRRSLLPALYRNCSHNLRFGNDVGRLFEVGVSIHKAAAGKAERFTGTSYGEETRLAFCFWNGEADLWGRAKPAEVAMALKGVVESGLSLLGTSGVRLEPFAADEAPDFLHPSKSARVYLGDRAVGFVGAVHPSRLAAEKIRVGVAVAEFSMDALMQATKEPRFEVFSTFPGVERDVAFVMPKTLPADEVAREIRKQAATLSAEGGQWLNSVKIFDVFEGETLGEAKRSVAYRMLFQSNEGTLEDEAVGRVTQKLIDAVCHSFAISVRG